MIHLTHNDLDALGCMLSVHSKYKIDHVYHINYNDLVEVAESVMRDDSSKASVLIITDVSFAERPELLKCLIEAKKFVMLIDHHSYPVGFFEALDYPERRFKHIIDMSMSASKKCFELLKGPSEFKNLIDLIDTYDVWRTEKSNFGLAQDFNNWFWTKSSLDDLFNILMTTRKLPENFKSEMKEVKDELNNNVKKAYDSNLVQRAGKVTFILEPSVFNNVMIKEMKELQDVCVCPMSYLYKIRIRQGAFTEKQMEYIRKTLTGKTTGHPCAFSYKPSLSTEVECKHIVETVLLAYNLDELPF